jgi:16S rRNA (guanine527-N7)-methyltransferase
MRHFGESLYIGRCVELRGDLLDIGSGAGFPGLALKIAFPRLATTLLEPVAKKRAFLKEVARACGMDSVQVRGEPLADFLRQNPNAAFANATSRGLGRLAKLIPLAVRALRSGGHLLLWATQKDTEMLVAAQEVLEWRSPILLPLSRNREIWVGTRKKT